LDARNATGAEEMKGWKTEKEAEKMLKMLMMGELL
jgi:hypothetical protein